MLTTIRKRRLGSGRIAAGGFDFDDVHPQVAQKLAAERSHRRSQIENPEAGKERGRGVSFSHLSAHDRGSKMENGTGKTRYSILNPPSSIDLLLALVILDDVLRQPPAQNFRRAFGDTDAADLPVPPFQRQFSHQS